MKMVGRTLCGAAVLCGVLLLGAIVSSTEGASIHKSMALTEELKLCPSSTPCAWHVYVPETRRVEHIIRMCQCSSDMECVRTDEDLSIKAYVHRCRTPPPPKANATIS